MCGRKDKVWASVCVCVQIMGVVFMCACGKTGMFIERLECFWKTVVHVCVEGEIGDVVGEKMLYGDVFV